MLGLLHQLHISTVKWPSSERSWSLHRKWRSFTAVCLFSYTSTLYYEISALQNCYGVLFRSHLLSLFRSIRCNNLQSQDLCFCCFSFTPVAMFRCSWTSMFQNFKLSWTRTLISFFRHFMNLSDEMERYHMDGKVASPTLLLWQTTLSSAKLCLTLSEADLFGV